MVARVLILVSVAGSPAQAEDVHAKVGDAVVLHAAIERRPSKGRCTWETDARSVRGPCELVSLPRGARVSWSKVEADQKAYDNVPDGRFRAAEIGWVETAWREGFSSVAADVKPNVRAGIAEGAGTMRYRAAVTLSDGTVLRSPVPPAGERGGPKRAEDARKVTLRIDDSYLGYMSELANLPYIFGSTALGKEPHQAELGIGVDCADLMVYGLRRMGIEQAYLSSRTLGPVSAHVARADAKDDKGRYLDAEKHEISVGPSGVRQNDWIIFDGHVGAFVEDRGIRGVLDAEDRIVHIAWKELAIESFDDSGYGDRPFEIRRPNALVSP